ncbi:MAG: peroxidase [Pseudomonadota bacterium]
MAEPDLNSHLNSRVKPPEFDDLQGLLRFGHGRLTETGFMLLRVIDAEAAKRWLARAPVTDASSRTPPPDTALQVAFSVEGLRVLGVGERVIEGFSDEFIVGMAGDESRSRRLGDTGDSAPAYWEWGGNPDRTPHLLLLLYAAPGSLEDWRTSLEDENFRAAFELQSILPTRHLGRIEPFGFVDGVSQPRIDWAQQQSTDPHDRDRYSNEVAVGEVVLGYANEYGLYTARPLIDPVQDGPAEGLPDAEDSPDRKDFGRNGCYLVLRQLHQDVPGFWQFTDRQSGSDPERRDRLAAAMVGRRRDGTPLVPLSDKEIPGIAAGAKDNRFTYESDPDGHRCPFGAHIRRANPRTGDFPPGVNGLLSRLIKALGFKQRRPDEDLMASTRFHRLLRRGRPYGPLLTPEEAVKPDPPQAERGLQFICLVANISRQFEFVQNTWSMSSKFNGMQQESDPLLGRREPLINGEPTDRFNHPDPTGPARSTCDLPQFVTVRGGGYFFMPGLRALKYIADPPSGSGEEAS